MRTVPLTPGEVRSTLHELIDDWHANTAGVSVGVREHVLVGLAVYGLTAHVYALAEAALLLHEHGHEASATPVIRGAIECATTAAWIEAAGYSAVLTLVREQARNLRNTITDFVEAGMPADAELDDRVAADLATALQSKTTGGQRFEQRCKELEGGKGVYAAYRALSGTSHAGTAVVDLYLEDAKEREDAPLGLALRSHPKVDRADADLGALLAMVVLSTTAWSQLDRTRAARSRMKQLNTRMGTPRKAQLSVEGLKQQRLRERERKAWDTARRAKRTP